MDALIAGCAIARNFTLITNKTREFKKVKNLKLKNWF
jgi:predicted nucleic acid-binding protein